MKVPFFDLRRVYLEQKSELQRSVMEVLDSGHYILGSFGTRFEENLKLQLSSTGFVVGCNSGTDALTLSLRALDIGPGDEVITTSLTAIPTISAICSVGAHPVFVDIDPDTWLMDFDSAKGKVTSRTRAIIVVHLYGNMGSIKQARKVLPESIPIIEDVAQAQGASENERSAGTQGRLGAFSFYPTKNIGAFGDAGAIFCQSPADNERLRQLRNYGQVDRYHAETVGGINSRLDEIQAAILSVRLTKLTEWNRKKNTMVDQYRQGFSNLPVRFQAVAPGCHPAWHLCVLALESSKVRDNLKNHLTEVGIETLIHYPIPNHQQKAFLEFSVPLPVTEELSPRILSIPMNMGLTPDEQSYVVESIRHFFG